MVKNGHWGKVKLPNFKNFFSKLFFNGYLFDPTYWLLPQKLFQMIFLTIFWGKIVIFQQNGQNCSKNPRILYIAHHYMGKCYIQELSTWKIAYIAYFLDRVKKMSPSAVYSVFGPLLRTS